jgi:stage IV sporulation protein FB
MGNFRFKYMQICVKSISLTINPLIIPVLLILYFVGELASYIIVLACAFLHELGHVLTAKILKLKTISIEILPVGITARIDVPNYRHCGREVLLYLSGPLTNVILALSIILLIRENYFIDSELSNYLVLINLWLAGLNLLPVIPLDGGKILNSILCFHFSCFKSYNLCVKISKAAVAVMLAASIYILIKTMNITFFLVCMFIIGYIYRNRDKFQSKFLIDLLFKKEMLKRKSIIKTRVLTTHTKTKTIDIIKEFALGYYYLIVVINEEMEIITTLGELEIIDYILICGAEGKIGNIIESKVKNDCK